jgi:hypothetical protein
LASSLFVVAKQPVEEQQKWLLHTMLPEVVVPLVALKK